MCPQAIHTTDLLASFTIPRSVEMLPPQSQRPLAAGDYHLLNQLLLGHEIIWLVIWSVRISVMAP
jgi:hypothetical protein